MLIVGTRPDCTGHCYTDQVFRYVHPLVPRTWANSNRRLCPSCHSDTPQLPVLRRPGPEHRVIATPFEEGVYAYDSCLRRWRSERFHHMADQERRGRWGLEDGTLEEILRHVRWMLEDRRKHRVYREESEVLES
jgi:hypothetical protein